ncbi:metal ABC transporter permease [Corynebacterium belfantii]|uniref:metal ABC transporter permease n=1 Tax=Corynebacterium belfantii TaxID=2014537 RepID=UPI0022856E2A|nr:metal ABC transporter permease [Corynebacterium belfantii]
MTFAMSVSLLALVVALTAAIPGVVLVLRRQAMLSDALSHAVLPGIAVGALWTTNRACQVVCVWGWVYRYLSKRSG